MQGLAFSRMKGRREGRSGEDRWEGRNEWRMEGREFLDRSNGIHPRLFKHRKQVLADKITHFLNVLPLYIHQVQVTLSIFVWAEKVKIKVMGMTKAAMTHILRRQHTWSTCLSVPHVIYSLHEKRLVANVRTISRSIATRKVDNKTWR